MRDYKDELSLVCVRWEDIVRMTDPWVGIDTARGLRPVECHTVGWLLEESDKYVVLVQSVGLNSSEDVGSPIAIPTSNIKSVHKLAESGDHSFHRIGREA